MLVLPYIRLLRGRWVAGSGNTQRSHLVTAPRKALTPRHVPGRAVFREGTQRDRGPPPADRTAQQPPPPSPAGRSSRGPTPTGGEEEENNDDDAEKDAPGPSSPAEGNSPNGAAPDCLLANMHPPPATASQSGKRRARRRPASGQDPDLAQLQHLPLLLSERGRGTRDAGREQGRAPRGRGGSRRQCAAPGPAAPPSAGSAAPPARLRGLRGLGAPADSHRLLRAPPGSLGLLRAPGAAAAAAGRPGWESRHRLARSSARPAAAAGASLGPPRRPAPSAPVLRPARGPRHLCRRRRRGRSSSRGARQPQPPPIPRRPARAPG